MTTARPPIVPARREADRIKIDIVVHGRFHGFALGKALLSLGHDVVVLTNYPPFIVERFGFPRQRVRSFLAHGVSARIANRLERYLSRERMDALLHPMFGRWAARSSRPDADIVYGFSGIMEELLRSRREKADQLRVLVRGSAHIRDQDQILEQEEMRVGCKLDRPSRWMIAREEREYALADTVSVLSSFARDTFLARGIDSRRLLLLPLGVDVGRFRASEEVIRDRRTRILSAGPLRVLNVGAFSLRKGMRDLIDAARALNGRMQFRVVGSQLPEAVQMLSEGASIIDLVDRVPEPQLAAQYAWADVFLFPTLEDGFAAVLLQAAAAGLPIIATTNCAAPDFVVEGKTGWVLPIRDAPGMISRLKWCDENRSALAEAADEAARGSYARPWTVMASELVAHWHRTMAATRGSAVI